MRPMAQAKRQLDIPRPNGYIPSSPHKGKSPAPCLNAPCGGIWEKGNIFGFCTPGITGGRLSHTNSNVVFFFTLLVRDDVSINFLAVHGHGYHTLFYVVRILHLNVVGALPELSGDCEIAEALGDTGIYGQAGVGRINSQNVL